MFFNKFIFFIVKLFILIHIYIVLYFYEQIPRCQSSSPSETPNSGYSGEGNLSLSSSLLTNFVLKAISFNNE